MKEAKEAIGLKDYLKHSESIRKGKRTGYDEAYHIGMLVDVYAEPYPTGARFCLRAGIAENTFYAWRKKHVEFREAYERCLPRAMVEFEGLPLRDSRVNYNWWLTVMRTRFKFGAPRLDLAEGSSPKQKLEKMQKALNDRDITLEQYTSMVGALAQETKILEATTHLAETLSHEQMNEQSTVLIKYLMEEKGYKAVDAAKMILDIVDAEKALAGKMGSK